MTCFFDIFVLEQPTIFFIQGKSMNEWNELGDSDNQLNKIALLHFNLFYLSLLYFTTTELFIVLETDN